MKKFILDSIKLISGIILITIVIILWAINIILTSIISIVTWIELKLSDYMRNMLEEEDLS
jgi:hypothetical protein